MSLDGSVADTFGTVNEDVMYQTQQPIDRRVL